MLVIIFNVRGKEYIEKVKGKKNIHGKLRGKRIYMES